MKEIKKIEAKSFAKIFGVIYFVFGLAAGIFLFITYILIGTGGEEFSQVEAVVFGIGAPVILPVLYGVMGYVFGFVISWVYNAIARSFGGIKIELEEVETVDEAS